MNAEVKSILENENYQVDIYTESNIAYKSISANYDLFLIDIDIPKIIEINIVKHIKDININSKIMIIGSSIAFKEAYIQSCDEFIKKPYSVFELLLKIKNIKKGKKEIIINKEVIYNKDLGRLRVEENIYIQLSKKEDILFSLLLTNRGRVIFRDYLMDYIYENNNCLSAFSSLINRLRKKIPYGIIKSCLNGTGYYIE